MSVVRKILDVLGALAVLAVMVGFAVIGFMERGL